MCGIRCSILVYCIVCVTVVGCDKDYITLCLCRFHYLLNASVNGCNCLADSLIYSCVADHVAVCEVEDDKVVLTGVDSLNELLCHLRRAHLRLEIVCRNLWRIYKDAVLVIEERLGTTVEEECNVCIFLGLSDTELVLSCF